MKILITGATGFLGQYIVSELIERFDTLYILTRNTETKLFLKYSNVKIIKGDITNLSVIDSEADRKEIYESVDIVLHAAALYDVTATHAESYMHNVVGTQNVLRLLKKINSLKAFYYVSTIAVGDDQKYFLEEDIFPARAHFNDFYSETKYHAEKMVRENYNKSDKSYALRIIRPGIIVADTITGTMPKKDGPYYFIEAMEKYRTLLKTLPALPLSFNARTKIPFIPVDHCAKSIAALIIKKDYDKNIKTFHLISEEIPTVLDFLNDLNEHLGLKVRYIPIFRNVFHDRLLKLIGIPKALIPFMFSKLSYDKTRTLEELPELKKSRYTDYKDKLFGKL